MDWHGSSVKLGHGASPQFHSCLRSLYVNLVLVRSHDSIVVLRQLIFWQLCEELYFRFQLILFWVTNLWVRHSSSWEFWRSGLTGSRASLTMIGLSFYVFLSLVQAPILECISLFPIFNFGFYTIFHGQKL